jgi:superfamily II DNA/RNA helicase
VATDVAARGVHVDNVELVVHVDPPMEHKAYLHRSGRTARAGSEGDVVTVMMPSQRKDTEALLRKAAIAVTPQSVTAASPAVATLVGDVAAFVKPAPRTEQHQGGGGRSQGGGGRSQGANAQRKRAARDGQPQQRSDRSGRPAKTGTQAKAQTPNRGGQAARAGASRPTTEGRSHQQAPATGDARRSSGSRRAGSAAGNPGITVGTVVRQNTRGR